MDTSSKPIKYIENMQVNTRSQCASSNTDTSKINGNRAKRKLCWKLKFHHQALPTKYLDHYEASLLSNKSGMSPHTSTTISCQNSPIVDVPMKTAPTPNHRIPCSTVKYKDLPYMGEITLDNAKPRRGRKPKKADICNLIYKNYNTTVVEEPLNLCLRDATKEPILSTDNGVSFCKFKLKGDLGSILQEKNSTRSNRRARETKHKNKKSIARERLEKAFKERGFLIQTQQLESTHGATYCKFRQLRKFTRYLFRSWKHHLPGDVVKSNLKL